jgi:GNAT superfamily N-acetyltransferase
MTAVRRATAADAPVAARLLDDFNREFDTETPGTDVLAPRIARMLERDEVVVLLVGDGPDGIAQLTTRASVWADAPDTYLAELYVVPARRGEGLGRALLAEVLAVARAAGSTRVEVGTGEDDTAARGLYERFGFTNREHPDHPARMLVYELEL